jgi:hypothetical protein
MPRKLQSVVEHAIELANAAVDNSTEERINLARASALGAFERARKLDFHAADAGMIVVLVAQLRAVLSVVERRVSRRCDRLRVN